MTDASAAVNSTTWTIVAWIITVLLIPIIIALWKSESKRVTQKIDDKSKLDAERHEMIMAKLTAYCVTNAREHDELFTDRRLHSNRITAIETIHKIKGCDEHSRN
jgi:hypothetical protein